MNKIEHVVAGVLACVVGSAVGLAFSWALLGVGAGVLCWFWFLWCMRDEPWTLKQWKQAVVWVAVNAFDGLFYGLFAAGVLMCFFAFGFYMGGA